MNAGRPHGAWITFVVSAALLASGCLGDPRERTGTPNVPHTPPPAQTGAPAATQVATASAESSSTPAGSAFPGASPTAPASAPAQTAEPTATPVAYSPPPVFGRLTVWTFAQGDDEKPIKEYLKQFKARYPDVDPKLVVIPEDNYTAKVNTSLQAKSPPDVAIIEDMRWAKAGRVVELTPWLNAWGVPIDDFAAGGMGRMALEADPAKGIYGIGDFLGGYIMVYNKKLYADAAVAAPPIDRSLSYDEYAANCRAIAKPAQNPARALYGCASMDNVYSLRASDVFGADGHTIVGNGNTPEMIHAFEVGTSLVNDGSAPSGDTLDVIGGETDLFAVGKIAVTGSDFTEVDKYKANGVDFGIVPFYTVYPDRGPVLDTFTAPWGTFTESKNPDAALEFLRFIATDAQTIRPSITADPPLRTSIAAQANYGAGDPIKSQYLQVLGYAQRQVFVPNGVEAWDPGEVVRQMTVEHKTDAQQILDPMVQATQKELDKVWSEWEALAP